MKTLLNVLEYSRWAAVSLSIYLAFAYGHDAAEQFRIVAFGCIVAIAGLTGIESVFFARTAAELSGYGQASPYQRQSGLNNLALALAAFLAWFLSWDMGAFYALASVLMIFVTLSAANHAWTAVAHGNRTMRNLLRPLLSLLLLAVLLPFMFRAMGS